MITSFTGKNAFLSNFFAVDIEYEGIVYPSAEHAYVAAKTLDLKIRKHIAEIETPGKAKRYGRKIDLRSDWNIVKVHVMRNILEIKYENRELWNMLQETSPHQLTEGNNWGDVFWGECPVGTGKNMLGKLLMYIRDDITKKLTS